jgi:hypothetical protein
MQAEIKNGQLIITLDLITPKLSSTGKTLIVATSEGTKKTGLKVSGKEISLGVNAFIPAN